MKKNLISAIAGWKSAALLALVAMVAAVAFSGVLTTQTEAQAPADHTVIPGGSVEFTVTPPASAADAEVAQTLGTVVLDPVSDLGTLEEPSPTAGTDGTYTFQFNAAATAAYERVTVTIPFSDADAADNQTVTIDVVPVSSHAGGTALVIVNAAGTTDDVYNIRSDSTGKASFADNTGRSFIICDDRETGTDVTPDADASPPVGPPDCDYDNGTGNTDTYEGVSGQVTLRISIAKDSPKGIIYVTQGDNVATERQIVVGDPPAAAANFTVKPATGDESAAAATGSATIEVTVTDDATPPGKVKGHAIIFVTTDGDLKATDGACDAASEETSKTCTASTEDNGVASAELVRATAGTATVTALAGKLGAKNTEVTFFGAATDVSASSEQSSVEFGGTLTVTLTVTDADGSAVVGAPGKVALAVTDPIEGPADDAKGVTVAHEETVAADAKPSDPPYCSGVKDDDELNGGTNGKGQCVVVVSAAGAPDPATGGAWTINFELGSTDAEGKPTTLTESITLTVAGPPANIANDAEERYDQRAVATVTLTVTDEDGNLVGTQPISVDVVDGSVALLDEPENTKNGEASFTFVVRSNADGSAAFLARSGDAASIIEIAVGPEPVEEVEEVVEEVVIPDLAAPTSVTIAASDDGVLSVSASGAAEGDTTEAEVRANGGAWAAVSEEAAAPGTYQARARFVRGDESTDWVYSSNVVVIPEPEPEPDPPTWNNELVSGQNLVVWNGEDGADASAGAAEGVTAIWSYNTGSGTWDGYFPTAADVPGGNTLSTLSNGQAYVVIVE